MLLLVGAALCALAGAADLPAPRWRVQRRGLQQGAPRPERKQPNILLLFPGKAAASSRLCTKTHGARAAAYRPVAVRLGGL